MNYDEILKQLKIEGNPTPCARFTFSIPNAKEELVTAMSAVLGAMGERFVWLPEYDKVAEWLSANNGKGLLLFGNCGRGKSLLVRYAIPMLLRKFANRIVTVVDCGSQSVNIDDVIKRKFITLDDMGVEVDRVDFGTRRNLVVELINKAQDKPDTLLFISSNLTGEAIKDRYGDRIYDRIKYLCHRVAFNGNSLRK